MTSRPGRESKHTDFDTHGSERSPSSHGLEESVPQRPEEEEDGASSKEQEDEE